jgi:hypothetical protein
VAGEEVAELCLAEPVVEWDERQAGVGSGEHRHGIGGAIGRHVDKRVRPAPLQQPGASQGPAAQLMSGHPGGRAAHDLAVPEPLGGHVEQHRQVH